MRRFIYAALSLPLLVFIPIAIRLRPAYDDFCMRWYRDTKGIIPSFVQGYTQWGGRYTATLSELMLGGHAPLLTPILVITWVIALYFIFKRLLHDNRIALASTLLLALTTLAAAVNGTPSYESYVWLQGATNYFMAIVGYTVAVAMIPVSVPLAAMIAFASAGVAELAALLGTFALMSAIFVADCKQRWIPVAIASAVGLAVVLIAPGNAIRQQTMYAPADIGLAIRTLVTSLPTFVFYNWPVALAFCALAYLIGRMGQRRVMPRWIWVLPLWIAVGVIVALFAGIYPTSAPLPERAWVFPQYFIVVGLSIWMWAIGKQSSDRRVSLLAVVAATMVIWTGATFNMITMFAVTHKIALQYDSGKLLEELAPEDAWVIQCAKPYYQVASDVK